jgi:hypothetical protein
MICAIIDQAVGLIFEVQWTIAKMLNRPKG